jgi:hypothetical protein
LFLILLDNSFFSDRLFLVKATNNNQLLIALAAAITAFNQAMQQPTTPHKTPAKSHFRKGRPLRSKALALVYAEQYSRLTIRELSAVWGIQMTSAAVRVSNYRKAFPELFPYKNDGWAERAINKIRQAN